MRWGIDENSELIGQLMIVFAFFVGFAIWLSSGKFWDNAALWLLLMGIATLGVKVSGNLARKELSRRREDAWAKETEDMNDQGELEACRRRSERRAAIRSGEILDDGLSDWGRELAVNPLLVKLTHDLEATGVPHRRTDEQIFDLEEEDNKLEAAWKKKTSADDNWRRLRSNVGNRTPNSKK